jgi:signal transduction histidine kinase
MEVSYLPRKEAVMTNAPCATDYQRLFESAPCLLLVLTPSLHIAGVSHAYLEATMMRREDIMERYLFDVFPDNPDDPAANGVRNLRTSLEYVLLHKIADTMPLQKYDIRRPAIKGGGYEERFWSPVNAPVLDDEGKLRWIIHRVEDATDFVRARQRQDATAAQQKDIILERREMEIFARTQEITEANIRLKELSTELENSNRELESFSYSVSHDLRAPLRAIDGFSRMLEARADARLDEEDKRLLSIIHTSTTTMGRLIDDLLHFSRISRNILNAQKTNMKSVVQSAWQDTGSDFKGEIIIEELPDALCDPSLLRQVWINLIGNAIKYTSRQSHPRIRIYGNEDDIGQIYHICDNGAGFDMRYAEKLFNVFQRLHSISEFPGSGIGLAIVARIVTRHGGSVWAEGSPGEGASFHFSLPGKKRKNENSGGSTHVLC